MEISVQMSVYALDGREGEAVRRFLDALAERGVKVEMGAMSSTARGEEAFLWKALGEAWSETAAEHPLVMTLTVSNACSVSGA